jgi:ATP-dependent Clp protease ATP-binding subunit ClpC
VVPVIRRGKQNSPPSVAAFETERGCRMYEQLSSRVDQVIKLANVIAREFEQEYVGTEHVLLAIAREGTGLGARILRGRGATEARLDKEIRKLIKASLEDTWVFGRLPGSPHFKNVIAHSIEAARSLNSREVCTEHLLLGLLAEKGSVAYTALQTLGFTPQSVRDEVMRAEDACSGPQRGVAGG